MSVIQNFLLATPEGYQISRSVRLRSSASAYFNRTLSTPTSNTTWTFSCWLKRGALSNSGLFAESTGFAGIYFASDKIRVMNNAGGLAIETTAVFRDPSAWAHFVVRSNGTNITAYWNSVEVGSYTGTITLLNAATSHFIGRYSSNYFDGYLTEINFIDGQALTPSSFGQTNATTGVWSPIKYTGTYGTNGFYLNFSDNSAATAAAIGKDYSGNGNNWTPNNISVTAGVTYDSMLDVPTQWADGGNGRGNYCVLSPLDYVTAAPTNGNLTLTNGFARATMAIPSTGKWYWENTIGSSSNNSCGLSPASSSVSDANGGTGFYAYYLSGQKYTAGSASAYGASYTNGDVIGVAVDADAGTVTFYKNNVSQGVAFTGLNFSVPWLPLARPITSATTSINFGQQPFVYTPPTGFKALNTLNLPTPTILKGNQYMDATTYTGNGSTQTIVNSGAMQPDFVWIKSRSNIANHALFDSVRGTGKVIQSNTTAAEATDNTTLTAFNSSGFSLGAAAGSYVVNTNTYTFVGWQWKANGTPAVTNTAGSITSTVSAGATQGFSVVTYTGTGANATVGHGLGVAPSMIIFRARSIVENWPTWHTNLTSAAYVLTLNTTNAQASVPQVMNSTAPTSSVFSVGTSTGSNGSGTTYVAYCFAPVAGFSKFGSYTGNGSADGPFVFTNFQPKFVMIKRTDAGAESWNIHDSVRLGYNQVDTRLIADASNAEATSSGVGIDIVSNGFKIRTTNSGWNTNGGTYIYAAFSSNPFKNSLAR